MGKPKIILVAYENQENLGVGYISSVLSSKGFETEIVDFSLDREKMLQQITDSNPLLVGFSIIFQYYTSKLSNLLPFLRSHGITCHFTIGGHYPSLRFEEVLNNFPELDSVVRFEGELTLCELTQKLNSNQNWQTINGIAYRKNGKPFSNELRPLINDLDTLPFPLRNPQKQFTCIDKKCAFMLASRGCVWDCSFCSIRQFYGTPKGELRRARSSKNVVKEIKELYENNQASIFLFQDDDFFAPGYLGKQKAIEFVEELEKERLSDKILWKANCRSNDVETELFLKLTQAGLYMTYLGIESGNPTGLKLMNKHLSVMDNLRAIEILANLGILIEFGFMLTDPSSTFESVKENLVFLNNACKIGKMPATFCKMVPLAATAIEKQLICNGRLKGSVAAPDYDFLDPELDNYCRFLHHIFQQWIFSPKGLLSEIRWKQFETAVIDKFYPDSIGISEYKIILEEVISSSNTLFLEVANDSLRIFEEDRYDKQELEELADKVSIGLEKYKSTLTEALSEFLQKQQF